MIALMVFTNGRSTIHPTIASAEANLDGLITERWIHDDSGDPHNHEMLRQRYPEYRLIAPVFNLGFGGAISNAWDHLRWHSSAEFVWHQEDDFTFNRKIDLHEMMHVLNARPHLVNLALRRQPVNEVEKHHGGIVECWPNEYHDREMYAEMEDGVRKLSWLEHRLFFTTNPGMYRRQLMIDFNWPTQPNSERMFSDAVLASDPEAQFGYYGSRDSGEAVHHIGDVRTGTGY